MVSCIVPAYKTVSAASAGRMLGFGKKKAIALIKEGRLPAKQLDGRYRVRIADVEKFFDDLPDAGARQ